LQIFCTLSQGIPSIVSLATWWDYLFIFALSIQDVHQASKSFSRINTEHCKVSAEVTCLGASPSSGTARAPLAISIANTVK
jgi:hypothetical protein